MTDGDPAPARWLLGPGERGNADTELDARDGRNVPWTQGNLVTPLVHGVSYFRRLVEEISALDAGDRLSFTDWRGDGDELLTSDGPTVRDLLRAAAERGVDLRGLVWRSHSDRSSFSAQQNEKLGAELNDVGAEVLLDQRVRRFGSHHQKLVVAQRPGAADRDVAFAGGIDLCHSRRDDAAHGGDPQPQPMDRRYGPRAPWHDMTLEIHGPAVADLAHTFRERWSDPTPLDRRTPYRMIIQKREGMPRRPQPLPPPLTAPPAAGTHAVQMLRTYPHKRPSFPFARHGERSIARAYDKTFALARSLIYIEDQYLWSDLAADRLAAALARSPDLQVIAVVPRFPDSDGPITGPMNRIGQLRALRTLQAAAPDRVGVFDIENADGVPIYVHAKVCIVDDVWLSCGSDNVNRRSWTCDSELTCGVVDGVRDEREPRTLDAYGDGARQLPRSLRLSLWAEHLGLDEDDPELLGPDPLQLWRSRAAALDRWYANGQQGPRPSGQARQHDPDPVRGWQRLVAAPLYALIADPDGRSRRQRRRREL